MELKAFKKFSALVMMIFLSSLLFAAEVPALKGRVNDYANILSKNQASEIEDYLQSFEASTGIQLAVLTIKSLGGDSIESFGIKVADKWQLGTEKDDNGALLIVAYDDHAVRLEIGDGLEGTLTDAVCGLIIRKVIIPEFRNGNYYEGIYKGIKNMAGVACEDENMVDKSVKAGDDSDEIEPAIIFMIAWLIFIIFIIVTSVKGKKVRVYVNGIPINTINTIHTTSSRSSSSFGGFSGGGGHFSGGGASGHW